MVGANLERLVSAHDETSPAVLLVLEKSDLTGSALLPLSAVTVETEELGAHLEGGLLRLLVGPGVDFLGEVDDGLEVYVYLLLGVVILLRTWSVLVVSLVVLVCQVPYLALLLGLGASTGLVCALVGLVLLLLLGTATKHAEDVVLDSGSSRRCGIGDLFGDSLLLGRLDLLGLGLCCGVGHDC